VAQKSIIIIGAGLAGLSAGCYAQMNGYRTHIFEHAEHPGGLAVCWRRGDYLIDGGIHFLMGAKPGNLMNQMYRELGTAGPEILIPMRTYARYVDQSSGKTIEVTTDLDRFVADLKAASHRDSKVVDDLSKAISGFRKVSVADLGIGESSDLLSITDRVRQFWKYRKLMKYMLGKYSHTMDEYVSDAADPFVKDVLRNLFMPDVPVWFVLMVLRLIEDGNMALIDGGCDAFILPMEKRYKDLGGEITYDATVQKVIVENDKAVGVKLADGSERRADMIVSAADGRSTIFDLLDGRYVSNRIKERYDTWRLVKPILIISFGVKREFKDDPWLTMVRLSKPFVVGPDTIGALTIRLFNYSDKFCPAGKTIVQALFETDWDYWDALHDDGTKYAAEKERVASEVLTRLESVYPGLASQVEVTDVATPFTIWRYTLNWKGSYMGWLPTPKQLLTRLENSLPGLSGFYMIGQWHTPGGGVPPSLVTGRNLIRVLCHREKRPFRSSTASP